MADTTTRQEGGEARTLAERAYSLIRQDILSGRLQPGEKLRVEHLKQSYVIGASPLREALARLSSEGLVELEGQRGFRVAGASLEELWDITEARVLLEIEAVRKALHAGDDLWEGELVAAFHRLERADQRVKAGAADFEEWEVRNRDFHDTLVSACGSRWLLRLRRQLYDQHERYRRASVLRSGRPRDVSNEHRLILDAALARDVVGCCRATADHVLATAVSLSEAIDPAQGEAAADRAGRIVGDRLGGVE